MCLTSGPSSSGRTRSRSPAVRPVTIQTISRSTSGRHSNKRNSDRPDFVYIDDIQSPRSSYRSIRVRDARPSISVPTIQTMRASIDIHTARPSIEARAKDAGIKPAVPPSPRAAPSTPRRTSTVPSPPTVRVPAGPPPPPAPEVPIKTSTMSPPKTSHIRAASATIPRTPRAKVPRSAYSDDIVAAPTSSSSRSSRPPTSPLTPRSTPRVPRLKFDPALDDRFSALDLGGDSSSSARGRGRERQLAAVGTRRSHTRRRSEGSRGRGSETRTFVRGESRVRRSEDGVGDGDDGLRVVYEHRHRKRSWIGFP